jgi:predicted nucleotidyltransferase
VESDEAIIREAVRRIVAASNPSLVILMGSAARGELTADSDIDLLVVHPSPGDPRAEAIRLRRGIRGLGRPFDVIVISTERFEESKHIVGGIAYPAHLEGRVLYEAA